MRLSLDQLKAARTFLRHAQTMISAVSSLFFDTREADAAARMNDIATRIDGERDYFERLIAKASPNGGAAS